MHHVKGSQVDFPFERSLNLPSEPYNSTSWFHTAYRDFQFAAILDRRHVVTTNVKPPVH